MTSIAASTPVRMPATTAGAGAAAPNDLVGGGDPSARLFGAIGGAVVGGGAAFGILKLTENSPFLPVRIGGLVGTLGAVGGGAFLGQRMLGQATRSTAAEVQRAEAAKQMDLQIEIRTMQAKAAGNLTEAQEKDVEKLRGERIKLAESKPDVNAFAKWGLPIVIGAGLAIAAGTVAGKLTPDDGKGINAMFNSMFAGGAGAGMGAWAGHEASKVFFSGDHHEQVPAAAQARIDEIDAKLGELLGVSTQ